MPQPTKRKEGSGFDLPMAMGILGALEAVSSERLAEFLFLGELSLDGSLRPVRGTLPVAVLARASGTSWFRPPMRVRRRWSRGSVPLR